jgi:hypothetical protein
MKMRVVNTAPLLPKYQREIVDDLKMLKADCGVTDVAFMMPLHPEEKKPTMAKANYLSDCFVEMKERLVGSGLQIGILAQSTIGHGGHTEAEFQRIIGMNGYKTGSMCPLDPEFQNYLRDVFGIVTETKPDFLMVDDDFRLLHGRNGCFCDLHLDGFNKSLKPCGEFTRESLMEALDKTDNESRGIGKAWNDFLSATLFEAALNIREAIDYVDPVIPCDFCACSADINFAAPIAGALAGKTRPFVRINNARYLETEKGNAQFVKRMTYHTAFQVKALEGIGGILSEPDTCPHNCYSTSAAAMHAQIVGSLLNGCDGLKIWITRMDDWEPESGRRYRGILRENIGFYQSLTAIVRDVTWRGPSTPLPDAPVSNWNPIVSEKQEKVRNWAGDVMGRLGIPSHVGDDASRINMLTGDEIDLFQNSELSGFLSRGLLLDITAAKKICQRGLGNLIGVDVVDTPAFNAVERLRDHHINGDGQGKQIVFQTVYKLVPNNEKTEVVSTLSARPWYGSPEDEYVGAGCALFENSLGGRVATLATEVQAGGFGALTLLNEIRKEQLINILDWLGSEPLPVVVNGVSDFYIKYGAVQGNKAAVLSIINLGLDEYDEISLKVSEEKIEEIKKLDHNGEWANVEWCYLDGSNVVIKEKFDTMCPVILKINEVK